jgi:hypothetical protein
VPPGAVDHNGKPRAEDGDGDCAAISDVGAFEFQAAANPACVPAPAPIPTEPTNAPPITTPTADAAPVLDRFRVAKRIRLGRRLPKLTDSARAIRFTASEQATVILRFKPLRGGKAKRLQVPVPSGEAHLRFAGRLSRSNRLLPGRYAVRAVAIDKGGQRSAPVIARTLLVRR